MKLLFINSLLFISFAYVYTTRHSIRNKIKNHQGPPDSEEDKAYLERKRKKELIFDINKRYTQAQVDSALFEEGRRTASKEKDTDIPEDKKPNKEDPHIYLDISRKLLDRPLGKFRAYGEKVNFHYPSDPKNRFQKEELEKYQTEQAFLSDKLFDFHGFNASNYNYTLTTDALLSGRASQALKYKLQEEQREYEGEFNSFASNHQEKLKAKMIGDMKKVILRKKAYPNSQIEGIEYANYDPKGIIFSPYQKVNLYVKGIEPAEKYMPKDYLVSPFARGQ